MRSLVCFWKQRSPLLLLPGRRHVATRPAVFNNNKRSECVLSVAGKRALCQRPALNSAVGSTNALTGCLRKPLGQKEKEFLVVILPLPRTSSHRFRSPRSAPRCAACFLPGHPGLPLASAEFRTANKSFSWSLFLQPR